MNQKLSDFTSLIVYLKNLLLLSAFVCKTVMCLSLARGVLDRHFVVFCPTRRHSFLILCVV